MAWVLISYYTHTWLYEKSWGGVFLSATFRSHFTSLLSYGYYSTFLLSLSLCPMENSFIAHGFATGVTLSPCSASNVAMSPSSTLDVTQPLYSTEKVTLPSWSNENIILPPCSADDITLSSCSPEDVSCPCLCYVDDVIPTLLHSKCHSTLWPPRWQISPSDFMESFVPPSVFVEAVAPPSSFVMAITSLLCAAMNISLSSYVLALMAHWKVLHLHPPMLRAPHFINWKATIYGRTSCLGPFEVLSHFSSHMLKEGVLSCKCWDSARLQYPSTTTQSYDYGHLKFV